MHDRFQKNRKTDICLIFRFEFWYQPLWGFWLFGGSKSCPILKKSSRKDSSYQHYYSGTLAVHSTNQRHAAVRPPETPRNFERKWYLFWWKNHISKYRSPSKFAILWKLTCFNENSPVLSNIHILVDSLVHSVIGKRRVWKGGVPHLETKAEIMGGVVKFKWGISDLIPKHLGGLFCS